MTRRHFLKQISAAVAVTQSHALFAQGTSPIAADKRTICAISSMPRNGGIRLLKHMLSLAQKTKPKLLLIPTALGDDRRWVEFWEKQLVPQLDCEFSALRTFDDSPNMKSHHERIMNADVIFVTGGNTLNALAVWKAHAIDTSLRQAWEKGIVLGGESAGMISWFEEGWSDSRPEKLSVVNGLGFLPGSACPHYENPQRRASYQAAVASGAIKGGYGCHGGTALIYRGMVLDKVVSIDAVSSVFRVEKDATGASEVLVTSTVI